LTTIMLKDDTKEIAEYEDKPLANQDENKAAPI
jgi:hypothetical protein